MTCYADLLRRLPEAELRRRIAALTDEQAQFLKTDWEFWARDDQRLPDGDWSTWLILAGRGFGKTRTGAETVRRWVKEGFRYVNIIGPTAESIHDDLITGPGGIMTVCPDHEKPRYTKWEALHWPNGARSLLLSAAEPERIRGKNHEKLWCDELASWRYPEEAWDQAQFGLRIGSNPQAVVTTTPKPIKVVKALMADPATHVTRGSTYDNRPNLSPKFYAKTITKYEGTRLGRQELNAEILDDNPRALWHRADIDNARVKVAPTLRRVLVGLDPNVKNRDFAQLRKDGATTLDEAGIVVAGDAGNGHYYVLDDRSIDAGPNEWGLAAVKAFRDFSCDRIIGEVNNGGDMVEMTIRNVDRNVAYKSVSASRGKAIRAEPISSLYEQGRVHHVGCFAQLEDEMCQFDPITTNKSPNRMDALVWALTELSDQTGLGLLDYYAAAANAPQPQRETYPQPTIVEGVH